MSAVTWRGAQLLARVAFVLILGVRSVDAAVSVPDGAMGRREVAPERGTGTAPQGAGRQLDRPSGASRLTETVIRTQPGWRRQPRVRTG